MSLCLRTYRAYTLGDRRRDGRRAAMIAATIALCIRPIRHCVVVNQFQLGSSSYDSVMHTAPCLIDYGRVGRMEDGNTVTT